MKDEPTCNIVQDLLPNYIEKLTSDETAAFIDEHLECCEKCRNAWQAMKTQTGNHGTFPLTELKFLKKVKLTRIIAAAACVILALVASYLLYASAYAFSSDKGVLSAGITEYTSHGNHPVDAYVLETRETGGVLIAFFKDNANPDVFGFARLLKGINQRYRLVSASYSPVRYSAVVQPYVFETGKGNYYAAGGYNCSEEIAAYRLSFMEEPFTTDPALTLTFDIANRQFLDIHNKQEMDELLREQKPGEGELYLDLSGTALLNPSGTDITDNYRLSGDGRNWSSGTGTAEQFMVFVFIAIVLILGGVFARYFLTEK